MAPFLRSPLKKQPEPTKGAVINRTLSKGGHDSGTLSCLPAGASALRVQWCMKGLKKPTAYPAASVRRTHRQS
ncbi:hypothetical protein WG31_14670 (plasmid) [Acetobacter oryzifermentans]|uniref:Ig-like domain-containing protein n=1 Tax=Acetobacter oryzifermentans TaxID=1633874 RepID=A0ABM6AP76_9PROT|nr:hypothetical protein WG31_14670 [Acetobacter oryzifermentans]